MYLIQHIQHIAASDPYFEIEWMPEDKIKFKAVKRKR